jgi:opacity protein-like surface antigen
MRRLLVAVGLIGLFSPAFAADYGLPRYDPPTLRGSDTYLPANPTHFDWQGFYVGGQLTYGSLTSDFSGATEPLVAFALRDTTILAQMTPDQWPVLGVSSTGAAGFGGFLGYNFQWDNAIIGLELNYTHTSLSAVAPISPIGPLEQFVSGEDTDVSLNANGSLHLSDFATTRARFGWAIDNFMPYATIGLAFGRADMAVAASADVTEFDPTTHLMVGHFSFGQSQSKTDAYLYGFSAGAGLEVALTNCLFARADYEYVNFQRLWQIATTMHNLRLGLGVKF